MTHLGHGVGLRPSHYAWLLEHGAAGVEWFEVISENCFGAGGRPWAVLERIRDEVPLVLHGVGMGLGDARGPGEAYLARLREVIAALSPAWVSDHLCWGSVDGVWTHDLLPIPYREDTLAHVCAQVDRVQGILRRRLLLENITSYLQWRTSEMSEGEFLAQLVHRTGCGVLLDVNNLVVNATNLGLDPIATLEALPPGSVGQIHLAGHTRYPDGSAIDTHVGPVPDAVWAVYRAALLRFGPVPTSVEWDEDVPPLEVVLAEAARAGGIERDLLGRHNPEAPAP
jgi:uncharacterized protein (UPF0276 family)